MRRPVLCVALLCLLSTAAGRRVAAQGTVSDDGPRIGIVGGRNWARFGGDSIPNSSTVRRSIAGVELVVPVWRSLSVQAGALSSDKGERELYSGSRLTLRYEIDYIEVPVVARLDLPLTRWLRPFGFVGSAISFRRRCRARIVAYNPFWTPTSGVPDTAQTTDRDCDQKSSSQGTPATFNEIDGGLLSGAGLALVMTSGIRLTVSGQYNYGLGYVTPQAGYKNRVFSAMGGLEIPWRYRW